MKTYLFAFILGPLLLSCSLSDLGMEKETPVESKTAKKEAVEKKKAVEKKDKKTPELSEYQKCLNLYSEKRYPVSDKTLQSVCSVLHLKKTCQSEKGRPIFHYQNDSSNPIGKRILVLGGIHGDERSSSVVAFKWIERLQSLDSRNTWRIVPMANPDGYYENSRMNTNGVDLNRNFPTAQWDKLAYHFWDKRYGKDPRRFPGKGAASEAETRCAIKHLAEFKPDFVIAVHTPYGVLDFDGPKLKFPHYKGLPWSRLGNYPGSLGRYMWVDHGVPVLTIELKGNGESIKRLKRIEELQDLSGLVAIMTSRYLSNEDSEEN